MNNKTSYTSIQYTCLPKVHLCTDYSILRPVHHGSIFTSRYMGVTRRRTTTTKLGLENHSAQTNSSIQADGGMNHRHIDHFITAGRWRNHIRRHDMSSDLCISAVRQYYEHDSGEIMNGFNSWPVLFVVMTFKMGKTYLICYIEWQEGKQTVYSRHIINWLI